MKSVFVRLIILGLKANVQKGIRDPCMKLIVMSMKKESIECKLAVLGF